MRSCNSAKMKKAQNLGGLLAGECCFSEDWATGRPSAPIRNGIETGADQPTQVQEIGITFRRPNEQAILCMQVAVGRTGDCHHL